MSGLYMPTSANHSLFSRTFLGWHEGIEEHS